MLAGILTILKYLPDFIELAQRIGGMVEEGVDYLQIKNAMKRIDKAFLIKDPKERARTINDEFRKV